MDWLALNRVLGYVGALGFIGAAPAAWLLRARGAAMPGAERAARRAAALAALLLAVAAVGRLVGQATAFLDPGDPLTFATLRDIAGGTGWGHRWMWQLGAALLAGVSVLADGRRGPGPWTAAAALLVAATLPLTGHAQEFPLGAAAGVAVQALHVTAAGIWLGTLGVLTIALAGTVSSWPEPERVGAAHAVAVRFSRFALSGAALTALAGVILAATNLRSLDALVSTTYGRLVLVKVTLLLAVMGLGAWNWRRTVPALELPAAGAPAMLRLARSAAAEIALALAVLVATAVLSGTDAPGLGHDEAAFVAPPGQAVAPVRSSVAVDWRPWFSCSLRWRAAWPAPPSSGSSSGRISATGRSARLGARRIGNGPRGVAWHVSSRSRPRSACGSTRCLTAS
jgi:copper transport protein